MNLALASLFTPVVKAPDVAPPPRQGSLMERILSELSNNGAANAAELAARLNTPVRTIRTTLSYAYSKHRVPGFTRRQVNRIMIYSVTGD